jgi:hypothetical protein
VNDRRVYDFLDEVYALPQNNALQGFETARDIIAYLRLQWAGLFREFLEQDRRRRDEETAIELRDSLRTVQQLVEFLSKENRDQADALSEILRTNHPAFTRFRALLRLHYPVYFTTSTELLALLRDQKFRPVEVARWDNPNIPEFLRDTAGGYELLRVSRDLFDSGRLTTAEFQDDWVSIQHVAFPEPEEPDWTPDEFEFDPDEHEQHEPDVYGHDEYEPPEPDFDPPAEQTYFASDDEPLGGDDHPE